MTLVTRSDARLIADIEKLLKRTIELQPMELEELARPERTERTARPRREFEARPDSIEPVGSNAPVAAVAPRPAYRSPSASRDPFFDKPYEASARSEADLPAWDKGAVSTGAPKGLSPYIKPKKKVAALFGAKTPATAES